MLTPPQEAAFCSPRELVDVAVDPLSTNVIRMILRFISLRNDYRRASDAAAFAKALQDLIPEQHPGEVGQRFRAQSLGLGRLSIWPGREDMVPWWNC